MHILERWCLSIRHGPWLERADWLWNRVRPYYNKLIALLGRYGLERTINGTDSILVLPQFRGITEIYEPDFWTHLMAQVHPGDTVVDVGAFLGLYTIALAKRVGSCGKVVSFEPDPENFNILKGHAELNRIADRVELIQAAVGPQDCAVFFETGKGSESHISYVQSNNTQIIRCVPLDTMFANRSVDILKIDVEGYEEEVLKGSINLLSDVRRSPRLIYIEIHPYAWKAVGTCSESLLNLLGRCNYRVQYLDGQPVKQMESWGKVVAYKNDN